MQEDSIAAVAEPAQASVPALRLFRPQDPAAALGIAVSYLAAKPAFANRQFGEWSRVLIGQINRRHYFFAIGPNRGIQGFMGWAFTSQENAEAWVNGRKALSYQESLQGDCVIFNAWAAETPAAHRFLVDAARKVIIGKEAFYFKRFYKNGAVRPTRVSVNDFVTSHIQRKSRSTRDL